MSLAEPQALEIRDLLHVKSHEAFYLVRINEDLLLSAVRI
jgi:hypothetical protein